MGISFDAYRSKVVSYLEPEQAAPFEARAAWDELQEIVTAVGTHGSSGSRARAARR